MTLSALSERDICTQCITPALVGAGWDLATQVREEVTFTAGRVIVRGKLVTRGKKRRADYVLYHRPDLPLAIVGANDAKLSLALAARANDAAATLAERLSRAVIGRALAA